MTSQMKKVRCSCDSSVMSRSNTTLDPVVPSLKSGKVRQLDSSDDDEPSFPSGQNEQLTVGFNKDRSYVVRGDKIGVFKATNEGKMEHHGTLSQVKNNKGKTFKPKKVESRSRRPLSSLIIFYVNR